VIKAGGIFITKTEDFPDPFYVPGSEPLGFFHEAIEFLPGEPGLCTELVDGNALFPDISGQKR
jgi:hypothetical protein